jgi:TPR repeat protein
MEFMRNLAHLLIAALSVALFVSCENLETNRILRKAKKGDPAAQTSAGSMYLSGQYVPRDYVEAAKWFRKAADQGNAEAQHYLGSMYRNGEGVQQDYTEAIKWLRKAANQGDVLSQSAIGEMFVKGEGVTQNNITAYMWFEIASTNSLSWDKAAAIERDHFAKNMTLADIETAKKRAKICLESNYKQCD